MSKTIELNNERMSRVKNLMLKSILSKGLKIESVPNFNGNIYANLLGASFESIQENVDSVPFPSDSQAIIKAVINTIDTKLDSYAAKKNYKLFALEAEEDSTEEDDDQTVFEDAEFETQKGEEDLDTSSFDSSTTASDGIAEAIKSMFEDLANKQSNEIKNLAKTVLKLEKVKLDEDLSAKKEESGEFEDEIPDDEDKEDKEGKENEGEGDEGGFGDEGTDGDGDNPFADDSSEDEGSEENPFDSPDNNGSDDDNPDNSEGDNPFEDGEGDSGEKEEGDNPFEDGSDDKSGEGEASFESIREYSEIEATILGTKNKNNLFSNLNRGDIINFSKYVSSKAMENELERAYASEAQEDLDKSLNKYKKLTSQLIKSVTDTLALGNAIGFKMDMDYIKYPHLYEK